MMVDLKDDPFSLIQAITACGVIVWDATDEEIIAANETAARILGMPIQTLLGAAAHQQPRLLRSDDTELPWEKWPTAVALRAGQARPNAVLGVVGRDGQHRWVRVHAEPLRRGDGVVRWVVLSFVDVADQAGAGERRA